MITILGTILGLIGSFVPEILKFLKAKDDHKFELDMAKLQMDAMKVQGQIRLEEINTQADIEESKALYQQAKQELTGVHWIDGLIALYASSVRPTVTYAFVIFYALIKYARYESLKYEGIANPLDILQMLWTDVDMSAFMTVLGFWFGARFLRYSLQHIGPQTIVK